tara:strand:+ start:122 stop:709 length:588 start_codon:yes stop_codon:yes gene_type:complete
MNSVTYDHPDPSIYTVLTCQSSDPGVAIADFVIFPPRWMPAEHTFRPPWYHRNCMCEYMGMIYGVYDAKGGASGKTKDGKAKSGFVPGGSSLHSPMQAHGPDHSSYAKAMAADLKPHYFDGGLAFMFETKYTVKLSKWSANSDNLDRDYHKTWASLPRRFDPSNIGTTNSSNLTDWRNDAKEASAKTPRAPSSGK